MPCWGCTEIDADDEDEPWVAGATGLRCRAVRPHHRFEAVAPVWRATQAAMRLCLTKKQGYSRRNAYQ